MLGDFLEIFCQKTKILYLVLCIEFSGTLSSIENFQNRKIVVLLAYNSFGEKLNWKRVDDDLVE